MRKSEFQSLKAFIFYTHLYTLTVYHGFLLRLFAAYGMKNGTKNFFARVHQHFTTECVTESRCIVSNTIRSLLFVQNSQSLALKQNIVLTENIVSSDHTFLRVKVRYAVSCFHSKAFIFVLFIISILIYLFFHLSNKIVAFLRSRKSWIVLVVGIAYIDILSFHFM